MFGERRKSSLALTAIVLLSASIRLAFADGDATAPPVTVTYATGTTLIQTIQDGVKYFSNRRYTLGPHNPEINGLMFTV